MGRNTEQNKREETINLLIGIIFGLPIWFIGNLIHISILNYFNIFSLIFKFWILILGAAIVFCDFVKGMQSIGKWEGIWRRRRRRFVKFNMERNSQYIIRKDRKYKTFCRQPTIYNWTILILSFIFEIHLILLVLN